MSRFDEKLRNNKDWRRAENNNKWFIEHVALLYPVRPIINMAKGVDIYTFIDEDEAIEYLHGKGFTVLQNASEKTQDSTWLFQSNPDIYDLVGALKKLTEMTWVVRQYAGSIYSGDTVYLWESGTNAGVVAIATVISSPQEMEQDELEESFYKDISGFEGKQLRVRLHIEKILPERIKKSALQADPILKGFYFLKFPQGTNFKLTPKQAAALKALVSSTPVTEEYTSGKSLIERLANASRATEETKVEPEASQAKPVGEADLIEQLKATFEEFRADPLTSLRIKVRRKRAAQLRQALATSGRVDVINFFNHEVWVFEDDTRLGDVSIKGTIFGNKALEPARIAELEEALESDKLTLRGNYIWGSGARVYGSTMVRQEDGTDSRAENIGQALRILLSTGALTPLEKAEGILKIKGFGQNITTGLLMVFYPDEFAIYNTISQETMRLLGYRTNTLPIFQEESRKLKQLLGAEDFLEQDWFLYCLTHELDGEIESLKELRQLLEVNPDDALEEEDDDGAVLSLREWQQSIVTGPAFIERLVKGFPEWLTTTFGETITLKPRPRQRLSILISGRIQFILAFNKKNGLYVQIHKPSSEILNLLKQDLSKPETLMTFGDNPDIYRFIIYNAKDYELLQKITSLLANNRLELWPPQPLDGAAFVVIHGSDFESQKYGESYTFTKKAAGDSKELIEAIKKIEQTPVYLIIYRPGPKYAFTAWAKVNKVSEELTEQTDEVEYKLSLQQFEFPEALNLQDAANPLRKQIEWLGGTLVQAFNFHSIRKISNEDFSNIIKAARGEKIAMNDAAFTILNEMESKTSSLRDILDKAKERGLLDKQVTATELASALLRDNTRFIKLGSDNWKILEARSIDSKPPVQVAFAIYKLGNGAKLQEYYLTTSNFKLGYQPDPALTIAPGVSLLLASPDGSILPLQAKVTAINAGSLEVEAQKHFNRAVSQAEVAQIIGQPLEQQLLDLTQAKYEEIARRMGNKRMEEPLLLDYVVRYITNSGYYFDKETIYNYHICLKTRPFVILAGLSGTGKSKLAQLYAQALGSTVENGRYLRLAVRPGWNDDRYLLGYLNTLTGEYETEPAVDFLLQAAADPTNLYFMCLDEMNLAHVEHYFSQFLSALEEDKPENRIIPLIGKSAWKRLVAQHGHDKLAVSQQVSIPANLLFIGTINVDETTQMLSDKVIDRANTIEFFEVDLDKIPEPKALPELVDLSSVGWSSYQSRQLDKTYHDQIIEIGKILNKADLGLGYRVLKDIELYLSNSKGLLGAKVAFDLQMKQRILPRVRGSDTETTRKLLEELINFTKQQQLPRSQKRLEEMQRRLKRDGYTGFWR